MSETRIGFGVDIHQFASMVDPTSLGAPTSSPVFSGAADSCKPLILGGVVFPGEMALVGHSDADALAHAVSDAILGAAGLGDIGMHFPDTDERYKGANSLVLLRASVDLAREHGWRLVNGDCTVVTERPRVAPSRELMIERLSAAAGGPVHVKATRPEKLGAIGRMEGLACFAVVLLERSSCESTRESAYIEDDCDEAS